MRPRPMVFCQKKLVRPRWVTKRFCTKFSQNLYQKLDVLILQKQTRLADLALNCQNKHSDGIRGLPGPLLQPTPLTVIVWFGHKSTSRPFISTPISRPIYQLSQVAKNNTHQCRLLGIPHRRAVHFDKRQQQQWRN